MRKTEARRIALALIEQVSLDALSGERMRPGKKTRGTGV